MKRPNAGHILIILWICLPLVGGGFYLVGGNLLETWRAQPPTAAQETDCQVEAMMGGDNPVEVSRITRACLQAVNDAYVAPRRNRYIAFSVAVLLGGLAALSLATLVRARAA